MTACCLRCEKKLNWTQQRIQFARIRERTGATEAEIKAYVPRCQKCTTLLLKDWPTPPPPSLRELFLTNATSE